MRYTIKEAAKATALSERTIRRRIKEGDLPARKDLRGQQELWTVDVGDLAAWAQATGQAMTDIGQGLPEHDNNPGQRPAESMAESMAVIGQTPDSMAAGAGNPGQTQALALDSDRHELAATLDRARQRERELTEERDWLRRELTATREALGDLAKALPPAPIPTQTVGRTWWQRLFRGKEEGGNA